MNNLKKQEILTFILVILFGIYFSINNQNQIDAEGLINNGKNSSYGVKIGYEILNGVEKKALNAGDLSTIEIWEKYLDAHNNKDLETIRSFNHDDIRILGPKGEIINGSDEHIEFLNNWFNKNNPSWSTYYMIANELIENDTLKQYVTSCHELTLSIDSNQIKVGQIHDALILDGKVKKFYVYERNILQPNQ